MGPFLQRWIDYDVSLTNTAAEILTSDPLGWNSPSLLFLTVYNPVFFLLFHYTKCLKALSYSLTQLFQKNKRGGGIPWRQPATVSSRDVPREQEKAWNQSLALSLCIFLTLFSEDPHPKPHRLTAITHVKPKRSCSLTISVHSFPSVCVFTGISLWIIVISNRRLQIISMKITWLRVELSESSSWCSPRISSWTSI